jgi:transcriptional regulator with PAS, ATPase and Fis domain
MKSLHNRIYVCCRTRAASHSMKSNPCIVRFGKKNGPKRKKTAVTHDFKGLGFSKIGHFQEIRSKIKELEKLNIKLAQRHNRLEAIFNSMADGVTILDRNMTVVFAIKIQKKMFPEINLIGKQLNFFPNICLF